MLQGSRILLNVEVGRLFKEDGPLAIEQQSTFRTNGPDLGRNLFRFKSHRIFTTEAEQHGDICAVPCPLPVLASDP